MPPSVPETARAVILWNRWYCGAETHIAVNTAAGLVHRLTGPEHGPDQRPGIAFTTAFRVL